jgi:hypothetical protein
MLMGILGRRTLVVRTVSVAPDKPRFNDADRQNIRYKAEEKSYRHQRLWYLAHKTKNETYYPNAPGQQHRDRSCRTWGHKKIRSHAVFRRPNGTVAKLRAASHTNSDAARQLPRQTLVWRERSATGVTPSHTLVQARKRRTSVSAVRQLQLLVWRRSASAWPNHLCSRRGLW